MLRKRPPCTQTRRAPGRAFESKLSVSRKRWIGKCHLLGTGQLHLTPCPRLERKARIGMRTRCAALVCNGKTMASHWPPEDAPWKKGDSLRAAIPVIAGAASRSEKTFGSTTPYDRNPKSMPHTKRRDTHSEGVRHLTSLPSSHNLEISELPLQKTESATPSQRRCFHLPDPCPGRVFAADTTKELYPRAFDHVLGHTYNRHWSAVQPDVSFGVGHRPDEAEHSDAPCTP